MDFNYQFISIPGGGVKVTINGYYAGNPAHNVKIYAYNWGGFVYDALTADAADFPSDSSDQDYAFWVTNPAHFNSGSIKLRINHVSSGTAGHFFYLDQLRLHTTTTTSTTSSTTTAP